MFESSSECSQELQFYHFHGNSKLFCNSFVIIYFCVSLGGGYSSGGYGGGQGGYGGGHGGYGGGHGGGYGKGNKNF